MKRPSVLFETGKHITRVNEVQKLKDEKKKAPMSSFKWLMNDVERGFAMIRILELFSSCNVSYFPCL